MIVVISDVHLGYEKCNREGFESFVDTFLATEDISYLILLGDVLDFWRRNAENVMLENKDILRTVGALNLKRYYVVGNHDYNLLNSNNGLPFEFVKTLSLQSGGKKFRFIHGYQIESYPLIKFYEGISQVLCTAGDETGQIMSDIWDFYQRKIRGILSREEVYEPRLSNLSKEELEEIVKLIMRYPEEKPLYGCFTEKQIEDYRDFAHVSPDEILVYGHTHNPCVKSNEANAGSWVSGSRRPNSYLTIEGREVTVNYWESGSETAVDQVERGCEYAEVF